VKNIAETFIRDLEEDSVVLKLLKEIADLTHFSLTPHLKNSMVIHYIKDYRARRPISKESIESIPLPGDWLLTKKIKKLHETDIYDLCNNIARMNRISIENVSGKTLYIFLDQYLKDNKKKKKKILSPLRGYSLT
jgi:TATA-binding protein-associated factor Taf7